MSRRGRRVGWVIIVCATVFIAGYLLRFGETAYGVGQPPAAVRPAYQSTETNPTPPPVVAPASPTEETPVAAPEPPADAPPSAAPAGPAAKPGAALPKPLSAQPSREPPPPPPPTAPIPEGVPRLKFPQPEFDFGTLFQEEKVTHDFVFENAGQAPLKIQKVEVTCGCTAAKPPAGEIAPGEKGAIEVTFEAGRMRDRVTKHIYVTSNDPAEPRATLTITGVVKVEVDVTPTGIHFGAIKVGETVTRSVVVKPVAVKSFKILEVKSSDPAITVSKPEPAGRPEPEGSYRLTITIGPMAESRRVNANLLIRTDLVHQKEFTISIYGRVTEKQATAQLPSEKASGPAPKP